MGRHGEAALLAAACEGRSFASSDGVRACVVRGHARRRRGLKPRRADRGSDCDGQSHWDADDRPSRGKRPCHSRRWLSQPAVRQVHRGQGGHKASTVHRGCSTGRDRRRSFGFGRGSERRARHRRLRSRHLGPASRWRGASWQRRWIPPMLIRQGGSTRAKIFGDHSRYSSQPAVAALTANAVVRVGALIGVKILRRVVF